MFQAQNVMGSHRFGRSISKDILEIDPQTIKINKVIDRGSYGTVKTAIWNNQDVAVKIFETPTEIEAFRTEVEVLGSVSHDNIIQLYGMCVGVECMIVMELATQGSLYHLLHKRSDLGYSREHMIVWWAEIADAVAYLHNHKPKPIIHRDLKSSNILLKDTHIRICDFGTACDVHTIMSNAKGTVAWMAPEVITTTDYNEKCDVYSFGVIMWEIIMRRVPFKKMSQFQIMRAVSDQKFRPPLVDSIPTSIRTLIQLCWAHEPTCRPSFNNLLSLLNKVWDSLTGDFVSPGVQDNLPTTPEQPGPSGVPQPSPPRFPVTPGSCSPSPMSYEPMNSSTPQPILSFDERFKPSQHIAAIPESCALYRQHLQAFEELKMLKIHHTRKMDTVKKLKERFRTLHENFQRIDRTNEGKQLRLSLLKSTNDSLNAELNNILDPRY